MGSYLPLKIDGKLYPVKVGGYTGKNEPKLSLSREQLTRLKRATRDGDEAVMRQLESVVNATAVEDIRTAYMAWIPSEVVKQAGVTQELKSLTFVLPIGDVKVKVGTSSKWLTKKTRGRTKPLTVWFGPQGERVMPFKALSTTDIRAGLYQGIKLLDGFTLSRKPKAKTTTYYRKATGSNAAKRKVQKYYVVEYDDIDSSNLEDQQVAILTKQPTTNMGGQKLDEPGWLGTTNNVHMFYHGEFDSRDKAIAFIDRKFPRNGWVGDDDKMVESDDVFYVKMPNEAKAPFKGSVKVTRDVHPRKSSALGRSGEINLPNPKRRTGRQAPTPKRTIDTETGQVTTHIKRHPSTSKTGEKTDVGSHERKVGKAKGMRI